jgi:hypothetical protein
MNEIHLMACSESVLQAVHQNETAGNLPLRGLRLTALFAVSNGSVADGLVKQAAERSQALEPNFETDIRNPQVSGAQQFLGLFDAALNQILMWRFVKCLPEKPKKMVARKTGMTGHLIKIQGEIVAEVDKLAGAAKPVVDVRGSELQAVRCWSSLAHVGFPRLFD